MSSRAVALFAVLGIAAMAVPVAAVHDHHLSDARMLRAETGKWYCDHKRARCGGEDSDRLHDAWERREMRYKTAEGTVGAAIFIAGGIVLLRRRP